MKKACREGKTWEEGVLFYGGGGVEVCHRGVCM